MTKHSNNEEVWYEMRPELFYEKNVTDLRDEIEILSEDEERMLRLLKFNPKDEIPSMFLNILQILPRWRSPLNKMFNDGTIKMLCRILPQLHIKAPHNLIYMFNAYQSIEPGNVRIIMVGQDPYPGLDPVTKIPYACGRSFACPNDCKQLPGSQQSLRELVLVDTGMKSRADNMLQSWVDQGVLLVNNSLTLHNIRNSTVSVSSSAKTIWLSFTEHMMAYMLSINPNVIIVLFGKSAQALEVSIRATYMDASVIKCPHPSKRVADGSFMKSKLFARINNVVSISRERPIEW